MINKLEKRIMITGGSGFIGSALIRHLMKNPNYTLLNYDKLTYSSNNISLSQFEGNKKYHFICGDILNSSLFSEALENFKPNVIMNLAAETHVDRSIEDPSIFVQSNIVGTSIILERSLDYWNKLLYSEKESFRLHHISTDEVFGSLKSNSFFNERSNYNPSSPYSASKAAADHLVRSWHKTYGLPILLTNCSNNYGPYQFPEKLIPLIIMNAVSGKELPIYGNGQQERDWLFVDDHAKALHKVVTHGKIGETYNIGGNNVKSNLEVVKAICDNLDIIYKKKLKKQNKYSDLIKFVVDRPGHDIRYAIDATKIKNELGWQPQETFETGIKKTLLWYLDNMKWCKAISSKGNYNGERLGLMKKNN